MSRTITSYTKLAQDYYAILEVAPDAPLAEVKAAYRRLALVHHPDKNNGSLNATTKTQLINEAWELLRDEHARAEYDRKHQPVEPTPMWHRPQTRHNFATPRAAREESSRRATAQAQYRAATRKETERKAAAEKANPAAAKPRQQDAEWQKHKRTQEEGIFAWQHKVQDAKNFIWQLEARMRRCRAKLLDDELSSFEAELSPMVYGRLSEDEKDKLREAIADCEVGLAENKASLEQCEKELQERMDYYDKCKVEESARRAAGRAM